MRPLKLKWKYCEIELTSTRCRMPESRCSLSFSGESACAPSSGGQACHEATCSTLPQELLVQQQSSDLIYVLSCFQLYDLGFCFVQDEL
mmetsp:Transcript_55817/g.88529  ORF Transcript_55817/g.88529 Transcript_55817/m.88529 type:complete len:89 (+) Transcript_55817:535-801(+)